MAKETGKGAAHGKDAERTRRAERLAAALRENLKRRKAQARARGTLGKSGPGGRDATS